MQMERRLRRLFRLVVTLFAAILSPWTWSTARKQPHVASRLRAVAAVVAICAVLIAPVMLAGGVHVVSHEMAAIGATMAWIIAGTAISFAICAPLVTVAAGACAVVMAA